MASQTLIKQGEERRRVILKFLKGYVKTNRISPTIQEIADHTGLSVNATRGHLQRMERDGLIELRPRSPRAISVVE